MRSRITIDLDFDNQPIIRIDYFSSEDVRDKMVKKFLETFTGGCWAKFNFTEQNTEYVNSSAIVRPIKSEELASEAKSLKDWSDIINK